MVSRERNSQAGEYATEEWGLCELAMRPDRGLEVVRGHNDGLCVTFQESRGLRRGANELQQGFLQKALCFELGFDILPCWICMQGRRHESQSSLRFFGLSPPRAPAEVQQQRVSPDLSGVVPRNGPIPERCWRLVDGPDPEASNQLCHENESKASFGPGPLRGFTLMRVPHFQFRGGRGGPTTQTLGLAKSVNMKPQQTTNFKPSHGEPGLWYTCPCSKRAAATNFTTQA